jgi:hypothetical protein
MTRSVTKEELLHVLLVDRTLMYHLSACTQHAAYAGYGLQPTVPPNNYLRSFNFTVMKLREIIDLIKHGGGICSMHGIISIIIGMCSFSVSFFPFSPV